jgi:hypothetical protein
LTPAEEFVDSTVGGFTCLLQGYRITIRHVEIHRSAGKHGVSDTDITHAYENAAIQLDYDPDEHPPRFALVGPDTAATTSNSLPLWLTTTASSSSTP